MKKPDDSFQMLMIGSRRHAEIMLKTHIKSRFKHPNIHIAQLDDIVLLYRSNGAMSKGQLQKKLKELDEEDNIGCRRRQSNK